MTIRASFKDALNTAIGTRARIYAYADPNDFRSLWDLQADQAKRIDTTSDLTQPIVVVWDGSPPGQQSADDDKLLFQQLSALDWAFTFSIKILRDARLRGAAKFNIVIVDLTSRLDQNHWASSMLHQLVASMPWLTLVAPLAQAMNSAGPSRYPVWHPVLEAQDAKADAPLGDRVQPFLMRVPEAGGAGGTFTLNPSILGPTLADAASEECVQQLATLARQWAASMGQVDEHHDLNNIIGPGVVAELLNPSTYADSGSLFAAAFMNRLRWAGLITPLMKPHENQDGQGEQKGGPTSRYVSSLDILVIDDRLHNAAGGVSWETVLARLLNLEPKEDAIGPTAIPSTTPPPIATIASGDGLKLWGTIDPKALLEPLGISATENGIRLESANFQRRRYDSPIPRDPGAPPAPWCLLLDLRLFGRQRARARDWYRTLGAAAKQLVALEDQLPWPGFKQDSALIESWLAKDSDPTDPQNLSLALSLLPRLCSLRWPGVPIILFSSAQDRRLLELLSPYANIDLASPKPDVFRGDIAEQVEAFKYRFFTAIERARAAAQLHAFLGQLEEHARAMNKRALQISGANEPGIGDSGNDQRIRVHLECYIDESGNSENSGKEPFVISAVVALYDNEKSAENWSSCMLNGSFSFETEWPIIPTLKYGTSWQKNAAQDEEMPKLGLAGVYASLLKGASQENDSDGGTDLADALKNNCLFKFPWATLFSLTEAEGNAPPECDCEPPKLSPDITNGKLRQYLVHRIYRRIKTTPSDSGAPNFIARIECQNRSKEGPRQRWDLPAELLDSAVGALPKDLEIKMYRGWSRAVTDFIGESNGNAKNPLVICFHVELDELDGTYGARADSHRDLFLDGRYDETIGQLIEGICFDYFAVLAPEVLIESFRIFMATRQLRERPKADLQDLFHRWGAQPDYSDNQNSPLRDFRVQGRNQYLQKLRDVLTENYRGNVISNAVQLIDNVKDQNWEGVAKVEGVETNKPQLPTPEKLTDATCLKAIDFHDRRIISLPDQFLDRGSPIVVGHSSPGMYVRAMHRRRSTALMTGGAKMTPVLTGAAAYKLSNKSADVRPRVVHGLADLAPRMYRESRASEVPLAAAHVGAAYGKTDSLITRMLLNACQSVDSNAPASALRQLLEALGRADAQNQERSEGCENRLKQVSITDRDLLVAKIFRAIPNLKGNDIRSVVAAGASLIDRCMQAARTLSRGGTGSRRDSSARYSPISCRSPGEEAGRTGRVINRIQETAQTGNGLGANDPVNGIMATKIDQSPLSTIAVEAAPDESSELQLTVSDTQGILYILRDKVGILYAMAKSGPRLAINETVLCRIKQPPNKAHLLGREFPVVVRA